MGLDVYLVHSVDWKKSLQLYELDAPCTGIDSYEEKSKLYTSHTFRIGYFRSSYSDNGFNRIMSANNLPTLYDIFDASHGDEYYVPIDWKASLERCNNAIEKTPKHRDFIYCVESLNIVKETIEFVLNQPDPENFRLAWSS